MTILPPYMPSAVERADARRYAANVRALMGAALGAPLSEQGIAQQQALKRAGVQVNWTGRRVPANTTSCAFNCIGRLCGEQALHSMQVVLLIGLRGAYRYEACWTW